MEKTPENTNNVIPFPRVSPCDLPATEDALNLDPYTRGLASFISTCPLPMTISLQGSWGSGKSSMMNLLNAALKKEALCVSFNTWQYSQFDLGEQLPILFYQSLMEKLGKTDEQMAKEENQAIREACKKGLLLAARLTAKHMGMEELLDGVQGVVQDLKSGDAHTPTLTETVEGLRQSFQELVRARLRQEKKDRCVFFVDDLDRLPPGRAVELMEVLKTALECDSCVFVLAIDYEVVIRGVKDKYGEDFGAEKGRSFFDKMIQLPFDLPVEQYQLEPFLDGLIEGIGDYPCRRALLGYTAAGGLESHHPGDHSYVLDMARLAVGQNPRSLKRFFNSFFLLSQVAKASCQDLRERHFVLLLGIVALKTAYPKLYDYLTANCHDSQKLIAFYGWFHSDEAWAQLQTQDPAAAASLGLSGLSDLERDRVRRFLQRFFQSELLPTVLPLQSPPVPPADLPEGGELSAQERWISSRDGLPFTVEGWQTLELVLEASAARSFWGKETYDHLLPVSPQEGNLRFHHLAAFLQLLMDTAARENWSDLPPHRMARCLQEMARRLADPSLPLAPEPAGKGALDVKVCTPLPSCRAPESELWRLFEQVGPLCFRDFRLLLEQALQDGREGGQALDNLCEMGTAFARDPGGSSPVREPFETPELQATRIREYFIPPHVDPDLLAQQIQDLMKGLMEES